MMTPKFSKSVVTGALVLGMSATGATVWAGTNGSLNALTHLTTSSNITANAQNAQLTSDYAAYVKASYKLIASDMQSGNISAAEEATNVATANLKQANKLIQQNNGSQADNLLVKAKSGFKASVGASGNSSNGNSAVTRGTLKVNGQNLGDLLGNNTASLTTALQNADTAQSQTSIEQNIVKTFVHLDAKFKQMENLSGSAKNDTNATVSAGASSTLTPDTHGSDDATHQATESTGDGSNAASSKTHSSSNAGNSKHATGSITANAGDNTSVKTGNSNGSGLGLHLKLGTNAHVHTSGKVAVNSH